MSVRLTRGEYWLLTRSVDFQIPLPVLTLPEGPPWESPTIQTALNCAGHGMSLDELVHTLHQLVARGWVALHRGQGQPLRGDLTTLRAELTKRWSKDSAAYYGLTAAGGDAWQQFARPDWSLYLEYGDLDSPAESQGEWTSAYVIAARREVIDRYLLAIHEDCGIAPDSTRFDLIEAWTPIYWKPALAAVRCRFDYRARRDRFGHKIINNPSLDTWCEWR